MPRTKIEYGGCSVFRRRREFSTARMIQRRDARVEGAVDDADVVGAVSVAPGAEHHRAETQGADLTPVRPRGR